MPPRRSTRTASSTPEPVASSTSSRATTASKGTVNNAKSRRTATRVVVDEEEEEDDDDDEITLAPSKGKTAASRTSAPQQRRKKAIVESSDDEDGEDAEEEEEESDDDEEQIPIKKQPSKVGRTNNNKERLPAVKAELHSDSDEEAHTSEHSDSEDDEVDDEEEEFVKPSRPTKSTKAVPSKQQRVVAAAPSKARVAKRRTSTDGEVDEDDIQDGSNAEVEASLIVTSSSRNAPSPASTANVAPAVKQEVNEEVNSDGEGGGRSSSSSRDSTPPPATPPPEETQPAADNKATVGSTVIPASVDEGPRKRLVIHKLVLVDFKSYADRQEIGPFHKSFSSIVGPNGSGKSNTIDALLFVFGFKATKMRQGKLSELIHNSEGRENIESCSVEVWFREIIDLPGPDAYEVVPNSTLVVARTAYRNNTSKYTINSKTSSFKEVTTLLKDRGIDLDHKRFLILQGEVESIAQMKPKAPNEHEDGLLEYLEDIIGTSKYKEPLAKALEEVDRLNEDRLEKTNRVKLVEREKSALEAAKKEADGFLKDQNELVHRQSELYQVYEMLYRENIAVATQSVDTASKQLQIERDSQAGMRQEVQELETDYKSLAKDFAELERHTNDVSKELVAFEREDVQMQEKRKHLVTKQKKLKKSISDDGHAKSEAASGAQNYAEDMLKLKAELEKHEVNLAREEAELEKICDGLKDKTAVFSQQIDTRQAELQPWLDKIAEKQAAIDLATNQRDLLEEKSASIQRAIEEAEATMEKVETDNGEKAEQLETLAAEKAELVESVKRLTFELEHIQQQHQRLRAAASSTRQKAEEAKANQAASRSKGDVLTSLTRLKDQGRLNGFHGRLGNLGRIDDKYDVAISTACGGLDNLVCDNVEAGQACLEHLRRNNLGRATILCLAALAKRDLRTIETPENAPRLFDLVTPKDPKYAPAFFQVLQNTLVAKDLQQANRIAFGGSRRWRVVTLDGKLIDTSGTMSGGGNRVARGGMSSKFASDEDATPDVIARLERDTVKADEAVRNFEGEKREKEAELQALQKRLPELEMTISKTEMAFRAGKKRIEEAERTIRELRGQNKPQADDVKQIAALNKEIEKLTAEHAKISSSADKIQGEIKSLQNKILEVGGVRLRSQQAKVEGIKEMSDHANDQLTKAEVGRAKAEKDLVKLEKALKNNSAALADLEEELAILEKSIREKAAGLDHLRKNVDEAKSVLEDKSEELAEMKALLDEKNADMNKFRARETELEQELEKAKRKLSENEKAIAGVSHKLQQLELHEIEEEDDEDEGGEEKTPEELKTFSPEELEEFDVETLKAQIALLEERIQQAKPNLTVLKEYKRREKEFLERAVELERVIGERDAAKQEYDALSKKRLDEFMTGFQIISMRLKELYQLITLGGNAELELVDSLNPFSDGITLSVMPPKKSWKNISNLSGGEKTLASLALIFALQAYAPVPCYFLDEIDAALDYRNVSIIAHYIKERTKEAQFIIISLRNDMFELASRLVGIYKTHNCTKTISIDNSEIKSMLPAPSVSM